MRLDLLWVVDARDDICPVSKSSAGEFPQIWRNLANWYLDVEFFPFPFFIPAVLPTTSTCTAHFESYAKSPPKAQASWSILFSLEVGWSGASYPFTTHQTLLVVVSWPSAPASHRCGWRVASFHEELAPAGPSKERISISNQWVMSPIVICQRFKSPSCQPLIRKLHWDILVGQYLEINWHPEWLDVL